MRCPKCGLDRSSVLDSRADGTSIRRRRECQACQYRYTTYERVELALPAVIKKDGRREPYERQKIRAGIVRACEKRPVSMEEIDRVVEALETRIGELCLREIPSRQIGDLVVEALRSVDKVAYIRFASVYREFSDVNQFVDALQGLDDASDRTPPAAAESESAGAEKELES